MKKQVIAVLLMSSTFATSAFAEERAKEGAIGFGSGAAIGAMAGGPLGALAGAVLGTWVGERLRSEKDDRKDAEFKYAEVSAHADTLENRLAGSDRELNRIRTELGTERRSHRRELQQALAIDVFFRTEESAIDGTTEERLAEVADIVAPIDGAVIKLEAHTDVRGTEEYNARLAEARAGAVRDALIRGGFAPERIVVEAAGEAHAMAAEQDIDGLARDRRVTMTIVDREAVQRVALEQ